MTKQEMIKCLRNVQNDIKGLNNLEKFNNDDKLSLSEIDDEINYLKMKVRMIIPIIATLLSFIIYEISEENTPAILLDIIILGECYRRLDMYIFELNSLITDDGNIIDKGYTKIQQIDNIERSIEFIQSLTEEEKVKYLNFKLK